MNWKTMAVHLEPNTIKANARYFQNILLVSQLAITVVVATIMQSQRIVLLSSGKDKVDAIYNMFEGKVRTYFSASIFQNYDHLTFIID